MAIIKFPDFQNKPLLEDADYIVGYKADGTEEYKTNLSSLVEYLSDHFQVRTPFIYNFAPTEVFDFVEHTNNDYGFNHRINWWGDVKFYTNRSNDTITMLDREKLTFIEIGLLDSLQTFSKSIKIDLSNCISLSSAAIYLNDNIESVDFSGCVNLESLDMYQNFSVLSAINITNCPKLKYCDFNAIYQLKNITQDDNQDTELENVEMSSTRLLNTDFLSTKTKLKFVQAQASDITNLDISSSYGEIIFLNAQDSKLTQSNVESILIGIDNAQPASVTPENILAPKGIAAQYITTFSILLSSTDYSGSVNYPGGDNAAPVSTEALNAKSSLISKGWIVETN